jgi:hypothetical protein
VTVRDELQARALFQERYGNIPSPTACQVEQRVIGGNWGANGYTTMDQADTLGRELRLSAGDHLLDLGTGRGWPGLFLAARTGCRIVLTDLPLEGLRVAANRAAAAWLAESMSQADALARLEPPGAFEQRQADRRFMLAAIHAGLLRRALVLARTG